MLDPACFNRLGPNLMDCLTLHFRSYMSMIRSKTSFMKTNRQLTKVLSPQIRIQQRKGVGHVGEVMIVHLALDFRAGWASSSLEQLMSAKVITTPSMRFRQSPVGHNPH